MSFIVDLTKIADHHPALGGDRVTPQTLEIYAEIAADELREWVGDAAYDDAANQTPQDTKRAAALARAEAQLIMYYLLDTLNLHIGDLGIIQSTLDVSGKYGTAAITTATPNQLKAIKQGFYDLARQCAKKYIVGPKYTKPVKVSS